ncbi:MAG: hypothetical protein J6D54_03520 [Olsenella sp.]|nr:hypothetical protein [Olsenella sp.]
MDQYLEPFDGAVSNTRNTTKLSRFSERLVRTFLNYHAAEANVSVHLTEYDIETLYKGLWNVCAKDDFRGLVRVHKQDGHLLLIREQRRSK